MAIIDYYFSLLSPYTYLSGDRLERIAESRNATINYRPIDFIKVGGETGWTPPSMRHPSRVEYRRQDLARLGKREDMSINLVPAFWPTKTGPASKTVIAADLAGHSPGPLSRIFLRMVWADEKDISNQDTISEALNEADITQNDIEEHLVEAESRYDVFTESAPDRGVFGVPFYLVGNDRFWGQDRLSDLDRYLAGDSKP